MVWMLETLLYGVLKGTRDIVKKKALGISSVMEVLLVYTFLGFLMVLPQAPKAGGLSAAQYGYVLIKSLAVFSAWIFSFHAISKMPISLYGVLDLSRVLFATFLGTVVLGEKLKPMHILGLVLVCIGLLLLRYKPKDKVTGERTGDGVAGIVVIFALLSCLLNAVSGFLDKVLMKDMNSSQLQFWYMLFMLLLYIAYTLILRIPIRIKESLKNYWIWILSILFVIADKSLFLANGHAESRITVMTLIKQSGCIVSILAGKFIFHEKNITHKLICAFIIIVGIVAAVV